MTERELFEAYGLDYDNLDKRIKAKKLDDWFNHENDYMDDEAAGIGLTDQLSTYEETPIGVLRGSFFIVLLQLC